MKTNRIQLGSSDRLYVILTPGAVPFFGSDPVNAAFTNLTHLISRPAKLIVAGTVLHILKPSPEVGNTQRRWLTWTKAIQYYCLYYSHSTRPRNEI